MSKKKERIVKLIQIHSRLNTPIKGASNRATEITYNRDLIIDTMNVISELLADDGIKQMGVESKE